MAFGSCSSIGAGVSATAETQRGVPHYPVHIPGKENLMTDIPSRSFGSVTEWYCRNDIELLTMFNTRFPLPRQGSWTVFRLTSNVYTRVPYLHV